MTKIAFLSSTRTGILYLLLVFCFFPGSVFGLAENTITQENQDQFFDGVTPTINILPWRGPPLSLLEAETKLRSTAETKIESPNFGFSNDTYWVGLQLSNTTENHHNLYFEVAYSLLDAIDFYVIDNDSSEIITTYSVGDKQNFKQRPVYHPNFVFPLEISSNQKLKLFVKISTTSSSQFPIKIWSQEGLTSHSQSFSAFGGALLGIILVLAIYNFLLFTSIKDRSYLYMSLTLFGYAGIEGVLTGFAYFYFWPNSPFWNDISLTVVANFALANLCLFSRSFLSLPDKAPKLGVVLLTSAIVGFCMSAASFIIPYKHMIIASSINLVYSPCISYAAGMYLMVKRYKPAYFYNVAFSVFVVAATLFVLGKMGIIPRTTITEYAIHIGVASTVVLLSFALADRINREKQEKETAQKTRIANLEKYRLIYESSLEGMFRVTAKGKLLACNPAFAKLMGVNQEQDLIDKVNKLTDYIPNSSTDLNKLISMLGEEGHVFGFETLCKKLDGTKFWGAIYANFINDKVDGRFIDASIVDITDKKNAEEKLSFIANHDILTGLGNRVGFDHKLQDAIRYARESNRLHALLFMDLDQFKIVNDSCGHSAGDELLKQLSTLFRKHIRDMDSIARLGGDEFAILLLDCSLEMSSEIADRLRQEVSDYRFHWEDKVFSVGISIGIVPVDGGNLSSEELLGSADSACYSAKDAGRNRVVVNTQGNADSLTRKTEFSLANSIHEAIENNSLVLYIQNLKPAQHQGQQGERYEILVRLDAEGELLIPGGFIPAAERFNTISQLDYWVIDTYLKWLSQHPESLKSLVQASINLSGQTISGGQFEDFLLEAFEKYNIPKEKICFEISESAAVSNLTYTSHFMDRMSQKGIQFSLDNFGAGFSSYSYLKLLPVGSVKIDGRFVRGIKSDPVDLAMIKSIIDVAHTLGLKVTAECVECEEICQKLEALGIDFIQGYVVHQPEKLI